MIWDLDVPQNSLQAYVGAGEGIHTYIQDTKVAISDRMKCNNGTFDEHKVCQAGEDGSHIPSETTFTYISTWDLRLEIVEGAAQKPGTLHYITEPLDRKGLYVVNNSNVMERAAVLDHSQLTGLLEPLAHADLLRTDAGNGMEVDIHLIDSGAMNITEYGVDAGSPIEPAHVDLSWYNAHGADSIISRHVPNGHLTIANDRLNGAQVYDGYQGTHTFTDGLGKLFGWPKIRAARSYYRLRMYKGTGDSVIFIPATSASGGSGGVSFYLWYGTVYEDCSLL